MTEDLYGHLRERGDLGWEKVMHIPSLLEDAAPGTYRDLTRALVFGDLWQRPNLTQRERRLVVLTVVALLGREGPMSQHIHGALAAGDLDHADLEELVIQLAFYAGWPVASGLYTIAHSTDVE